MSIGSRLGVTVRFNQEERNQLRAMSEVFKMNEKALLKFGFTQLVKATIEAQKTFKKEKKHDDTQQDASVGGNSGGDVADVRDADQPASA